jgi:hypothetical protein
MFTARIPRQGLVECCLRARDQPGGHLLTRPPQSIGARAVPARSGWKAEWRLGILKSPLFGVAAADGDRSRSGGSVEMRRQTDDETPACLTELRIGLLMT